MSVRRYGHRPFRALLIIGVVGTFAFLVYGFVHRSDASPAPRNTADEPTTTPCPADHTDEGAARRAYEGLGQLARANMGQADIEQTLTVYVADVSRDGERSYLTNYPAPFVALDSTLLGWQAVTYTPERATIRLATSDVATRPDGTPAPPAQYVTDVVVQWDGSAWMLALPATITPTPNAVALLVHPRELCHA